MTASLNHLGSYAGDLKDRDPSKGLELVTRPRTDPNCQIFYFVVSLLQVQCRENSLMHTRTVSPHLPGMVAKAAFDGHCETHLLPSYRPSDRLSSKATLMFMPFKAVHPRNESLFTLAAQNQ